MIDSLLVWRCISELDIWLHNGVGEFFGHIGGILGLWHGRKTYGLGFLDREERLGVYGWINGIYGICLHLTQSLAFSPGIPVELLTPWRTYHVV